MAWKLCTSAAAIAKAGAKANSTIVASSATLAEWSNEVEASIAMITRKDWSGAWAGLDGTFKCCLADLSSDMIAMKILGYDLGAYTTIQAQTMADILRDNYVRLLAVLDKCEYKEVAGV